MERRKAESKNHLKNLNDECKLTVELLNKLITTCASHVDVLENLNPQDFRTHSKYYISLTQFQYHALQKLLEINLDLEQFISETEISNIQLNDLRTATPTSSCIEKHPITPISLEPKSPITPISLEPKSPVTSISLEPKSPVTSISPESKSPVTSISPESKAPITSISPIPLHLEIETQYDLLQQTKLDMVTNYVNNINTNGDLKQIDGDCTDSTASSEYYYCTSNVTDTKSNDVIFDEQDFEKVEVHTKNVNEVLKLLPKPVEIEPSKMPHIMLQPSDIKFTTASKSMQYKNSLSDIEYSSSIDKDEIVQKQEKVSIEISERPEIKVNDLCMIGCVESPSCFYIQVADENIAALDILSMQIESVTSTKCKFTSKDQAMAELGKYCSLKIDNHWYRVEVLNWLLDQSEVTYDKVLIQLIDYGNKYNHTYKDLRPLLTEFYHIPKIAQLCHLDGLYPPGSKKNAIVNHWPDESIEGFLNVCGDLDNAIFRITHTSPRNEKNSFGIELMNTEEVKQTASIGQTLLDANLAIALDDDFIFGNNLMINQIQASHGLQGINSNTSTDDILDNFFSHNKIEDASNINEAVMHYNPRDEALTCRNLRHDGTCYKGNSCKLRHIPLKDGFTRDKEPVYNGALVDRPLPAINEEVIITLSHIVDIRCFYAQIMNVDNSDSLKPAVTSLIKLMNRPETIKEYKKLRFPPGVSQTVIVKHWNTFWYRGQVRSVQIPESTNNEVMVEVFIVDFGDIITVPMSDLRTIIVDFLLMPFQAVECRLYNVKHKQEMDEAEEKRYFESRYLGQKFKAKIIAIPGHLEVILYTLSGDDVGEILISCGYGETNDEHYFPRDNEFFLID